MTFRIPRGFGRVSWPYDEVFEDGSRPSYSLRPAPFLPCAVMDARHDDPVVLPPGTWIGRLNPVTHSTQQTSFPVSTTNGDLVPAAQSAYKVYYTSADIATDFYVGTPSLDSNLTTYVTVAGASSATVAATQPLGVVTHPYYAGHLAGAYENYDRQLKVTWLAQNRIIRIPAMTTAEWAIQPGDLVMLDDNSSTPTWRPTDMTQAASTPGRLKKFTGTTDALMVPWIVGRCTNKIRVARQATYSANQSLRTAIGTSAPRTLTNISTTDAYMWPVGTDFKSHSKTEVVPGTGLSGSSQTLGRPSSLLFALPDSSGDYWALDILVRV